MRLPVRRLALLALLAGCGVPAPLLVRIVPIAAPIAPGQRVKLAAQTVPVGTAVAWSMASASPGSGATLGSDGTFLSPGPGLFVVSAVAMGVGEEQSDPAFATLQVGAPEGGGSSGAVTGSGSKGGASSSSGSTTPATSGGSSSGESSSNSTSSSSGNTSSSSGSAGTKGTSGGSSTGGSSTGGSSSGGTSSSSSGGGSCTATGEGCTLNCCGGCNLFGGDVCCSNDQQACSSGSDCCDNSAGCTKGICCVATGGFCLSSSSCCSNSCGANQLATCD